MKNIFVIYKVFVLTFALFIISINTIFSQSCPTGIQSYWKLNETTDTVFYDEIGNNNAITLTATRPSVVAGCPSSNKAQYFNGSASSVIDITSNSTFEWTSSDDYSIEFWFIYKNAGTTQVMIGSHSKVTAQWWIGAIDDGRIGWFARDDDDNSDDIELYSTAAYNDSTWHHVVATRRSGRNVLYVDGSDSSYIDMAVSGNPGTGTNITIGYFDDATGYHYGGAMDELAVYNLGLSASEIQNHYNNAKDIGAGYCDEIAPVIASTAPTTARIGGTYLYNVSALGNPKPTIELVEGPSGMAVYDTIVAWTPASENVNGNVTIKASNINGATYQSFTINVFTASCNSNVIGYWPLDEESGVNTFLDYTNGTIMIGGNLESATGMIDGAQHFDGANDALTIVDNEADNEMFFDFYDNSNPGKASSFTISLWMNTDYEESGVGVIVGKDDKTNNSHFWIGIDGGNAAATFRDNTGNINDLSGKNIVDGLWHQLVVSFDPTQDSLILYVDGTRADGILQDYNDFSGDASLNIGWLNLDTYFRYTGVLDELSFYDIAMTSGEVNALYNNGLSGTTACDINFTPIFTEIPTEKARDGLPYTQTISGEDKDGDEISFEVIAKPDWMSIYQTTGQDNATLTGTPGTSDVGDASVTIRISDGQAYADQTFTVTVREGNVPPEIISEITADAYEDAFYADTVETTDYNVGDIITYYADSIPLWLSINNTTGILSGTPLDEHRGDNYVAVGATDGIDSTVRIYTITVINTNDLPVITDQNTVSTYEETALTITKSNLIIEDIDNTQEELSITVLAGLNYTVDGNTITPDKDFEETLTVQVQANDPEGSSNVFDMVVDVIPVNDNPVINSTISATVNEDSFYSDTLKASDIDIGDVLTMSSVTLPGWLSFDPDNGALTGTPDNSYVGNNKVVLRVSDGMDHTDYETTIVVNNVNDTAYFVSSPLLKADDYETYKYQVLVDDIDVGDSIFIIPMTLPDWLSFNSETNMLSGIPTNNHADSSFNVVLSVSDGIINSLQTFDIYVSNRNTVPGINLDQPVTATEGNEFSFVIPIEDVDEDDVLSIVPVQIPDWLDIDLTTFTLSGTPEDVNVGENSVLLQISDGRDVVFQSFTIAVNGVNDIPYFTSTPIDTVDDYQFYEYQVMYDDNDLDHQLTLSGLILPDWLSLDTTTDILSGIPKAGDANASHEVSLLLSDGIDQVTQEFSIYVTDINGGFTVSSNMPNTATVGNNFSFYVVAIDEDEDDTISYTIDSKPDWLIANIENDTAHFSGTPTESAVGAKQLQLTISDGTENKIYYYVFEVKKETEIELLETNTELVIVEDSTFDLNLADIVLPDKYTGKDVKINILDGANYSFDGLKIIPNENYDDDFYVYLTIGENQESAEVYRILVSVDPVNDPPELIRQKVIGKHPGSIFGITVFNESLVISDPDNTLEELSLTILDGNDYTYDGNIITWLAESTSTSLSINAKLSDGVNDVDIVITIALTDIRSIALNQLKIYPNPASDIVNIEIPDVSENIMLEINDFSGKLINNYNLEDKTTLHSININDLNKGVYFYRAIINEKIYIGEIIKK